MIPPTSEPAQPSRIVAQIGIGSGPGSASRARAPTTRPDNEQRDDQDEQRRAEP